MECNTKFRGIMGSDRDDTQEIDILGRRLRRTSNGLELEASRNPRLKNFGLKEDSQGELLCLAGQRERRGRKGSLQARSLQVPRRLALMKFLGQDRPDVQYATKEASQKMTSPAKTDLQRPKRIARYLGRGRLSGVALLRNRRSCGVRGLWLGWMFEYEKIYERWRGVGDGDGHEVFRGSVATTVAEAE